MSALAELRAGLVADGYVRRRPSPETAEIDAGVCAEASCPECGRVGLDYEPWIHPAIRAAGAGGYRALAVCSCGHGQEF